MCSIPFTFAGAAGCDARLDALTALMSPGLWGKHHVCRTHAAKNQTSKGETHMRTTLMIVAALGVASAHAPQFKLESPVNQAQ